MNLKLVLLHGLNPHLQRTKKQRKKKAVLLDEYQTLLLDGVMLPLLLVGAILLLMW